MASLEKITFKMIEQLVAVALLYSQHLPSRQYTVDTNLQAIAIQIDVKVLFTVCSIYVPPSIPINQNELNKLICQLPKPLIIIGDFNGHSALWGSQDTNAHGLQIERLVSDHNLCLLNDSSHTFLHAATKYFHTFDLAMCSPSIMGSWSFSVEKDLYNSDHFPIVLSQCSRNAKIKRKPPRFIYDRANWQVFRELSELAPSIT